MGAAPFSKNKDPRGRGPYNNSKIARCTLRLRVSVSVRLPERSATKATKAQAFLSAARRDARSDVAEIAPGVAAAL